ncbi:hypothetical protein Vadar_012326 [Vaccinium darrowii]|uniref:Uncharacterized protein n=1 Tax=Vaccinium darrowii TaxID=229202 RepID=A0ACB7Y702_9ERIC|nr:hypothetical protein Vadar_012326 [Vaccinium darrowii]
MDSPLSLKLINKIGWFGHRAYLPENHPWRKDKRFNGLPKFGKKSFDLPVEKIRHILDVMHIAKNICENLYGTMLGIDGKNKDTYKARDDLKQMGIRSELHLQVSQNGSIVKPRAMYTLDSQQAEKFYEFLKSISYPDGYAANISRCAAYHAFFDVMVHLTVHLSREAMIAGPVQYRWMYPIERFLGKLKGYMSNKARPEGSIIEGYIVKECISFYSLYLNKGIRNHERNEDGGDRGLGMEIFHQHVRLFSPIARAPDPSKEEQEMAHWFVLYSCPEVEPYLEGVWDLVEQVESPNDPFQQDQTTDGIPIVTEDPAIHYSRDDIDLEIILGAEIMANHGDDEADEDDTMAEYIDDEDNELNGQVDTDVYVDVDLDVDVDYDK